LLKHEGKTVYDVLTKDNKENEQQQQQRHQRHNHQKVTSFNNDEEDNILILIQSNYNRSNIT
jgi:hypothetical protein